MQPLIVTQDHSEVHPTSGPITLRHGCARDGADVWRLVRDAGSLEVNTPYAYLLLLERFAATTVVAVRDDELLGFVLGLTPPDDTDVLFVWQVAVSAAARGQGIAISMLQWLFARNPALRFMEATVTPDNAASERLFRAFSRSVNAAHDTRPYFDADLFPGEAGTHEAEFLHRIGPAGAGDIPINPSTTTGGATSHSST